MEVGQRLRWDERPGRGEYKTGIQRGGMGEIDQKRGEKEHTTPGWTRRLVIWQA